MKKKKKKKKANKVIIPKTIKKIEVNPTIKEFICITCDKIINPATRISLGNESYRHKTCGPGSRGWAQKFPSAISLSLYLHTINAVDFFEAYIKGKGYEEERFFRIKNAVHNFFIHLDRHLKTTTIETSIKRSKGKAKTSISGDFKSIRHLLETLFAKNKNITRVEAIKHIKKEFPTAKIATEEKPINWNWYITFIIKKKEFKCIPPPLWAQK